MAGWRNKIKICFIKNLNLHKEYSRLVWIFSGVSLLIYALLGLFNQNIPGVEELVSFISNISSSYLLLAAFLTILIEGLYIVGNFFPGASLVMFAALVSQVHGPLFFLQTIFVVFVGWSISGGFNVLFAKLFKKEGVFEKPISENLLLTWFPSFRANYEVSQTFEGKPITEIFVSSIRIKALVSFLMIFFLLIYSYFIDINEIKNEEGFITALFVAAISLFIGFKKKN